MLNRTKILMNKAGEGDAGGAPKDPPADPPAPKDPPSGVSEDGKEYDELGYEIVKKEEGDPAKKVADKKKDPPAEPKKVENPVTGYDKDIEIKPEDEKPIVPDPKDPPKDPPSDLEKKLEGLHPTFQNKVKQQIADLGLEGEKLDKFIALKKSEQQEATDWAKNQQLESERQDRLQKAKWQKELKEDPGFGGEKYLTNVTRGEKVLDEYLPELKKELTEAKQMLRPSVMRGLARLADQLYPDDKVVHGDPPPPEDEKGGKDEGNDPLDFYNSKGDS